MNKLIMAGMVFILSGCAKETVSISGNYDIPKELLDCNIYYMRSDVSRNLTVIRCPNSSTTTSYSEQHGKATKTRNITVIEND